MVVGIGVMLAAGAVGMIAPGPVQAAMTPLTREILHAVNRASPTEILPVSELTFMRQRDEISQDTFEYLAKSQGIDPKYLNAYFSASRTIPSPEALISLYRRGIINTDDFNRMMKWHGYMPVDTARLLAATEFMPSPTDIVSWLGREVFEPAVIKKFGLDDEFDKLNLTLFDQIGVSREMARNYWIAHWDHPSWTMITEMLHRGLITEDDVEHWFKLVEIPPYWRKALRGIMYNTYTRVDVRRMYELGVLSREDVLRAYMDEGYDQEKAEKMTEFTVRYVDDQRRDLTQSQILRAFEQGVITDDEAVEALNSIGYAEQDARLLVALKVNDILDQALDDEIDLIQEQYRIGLIDQREVVDRLGRLNLSSEYTTRLLAKFNKEKEKHRLLPSKEDVIKWFTQGVIDRNDFYDYMQRLGYVNRDIDNYVKSIELSTKGG